MRKKKYGFIILLAVGLVSLPALALAGGTTLKASLTGEQETTGGAPNGKGSVKVDLKPKRSEVCFKLRFSGIAGKATSSAIFKGKRGEDGPTKVLFFDEPRKSPVADCVKANKRELKRIKRRPRHFHVNVESAKYPDGAIRGQLQRR